MATLIKRGKNWYSYFKAGGKRINRSLGPDHAAAKIALGRLVERYQLKRVSNLVFNPSWIGFKTKFLMFMQGEGKPNTVYWYSLAFRHLENLFPVNKVDQVTPELLQELKGKLNQTDMSKGAVNKIIGCLKTSMKKAAEWGHAVPQDWKVVKRVKEPEGRLIWYTPEQCIQLLAVCKGKWKTAALLGMRAGLRRGEIAWLTWADIDFERNMIRITAKPGWQPKGKRSRHIPMAPDLRKHLQTLPDKQRWPFQTDKQALDVISSYFIDLIEEAGLNGSLHALRHTFGSHLTQRGVPPKVVMELMGHSNIKTTMIYSHLAPENLVSGISKLPDFAVTSAVTQS